MPDPKPESRYRWMLTNGAHLAVLSGFALAQPLLDILGRNAAFFAVRGSTSHAIVLFALSLVILPPLALLAAEALARLIDRRLARAVHLLFVGALSAVFVLYLFTKTGSLSGMISLVLAATAGVVALTLYWKASPVRSFLSILAPVPFVFVALFLFGSQAKDLVFVSAPKVENVRVKSKAPVVMIVFDELTTVSLMDSHGKIDAKRYPNFAFLARKSNWYRNDSTVHRATEGAIPSLVSGIRPPMKEVLPTYANHPKTLFTLLGKTYEMKVTEPLPLCPRSLCKKVAGDSELASSSTSSLLSDSGIVYLHLLLPEPYVNSVPPISDSWGNFGNKQQTSAPAVKQSSTGTFPACWRGACSFADSIKADTEKPTLYYTHLLLPHVPYLTTPSGRLYTSVEPDMDTDDYGRFLDDWAPIQTEQRFLLQVGYTDRALGIILRKLRSTGVFDKALIVVTSDHGSSFNPEAKRRLPSDANLDDIAFIPLFIKLPGQTKGKINDSFASSVDVLPTIARALHIKVPWKTDGHSLIGRRLPKNGTVSVKSGPTWVTAPLSQLRKQRARTLKHKLELFGQRSTAKLYRIGPHRELLGRRVSTLRHRSGGGTKVKLVNLKAFNHVDLTSSTLPLYLQGVVSGVSPETPLAVVINGKVGAMTYSYLQKGRTRMAATIPEKALRLGKNRVAVYALSDSGRSLVLQRLRVTG
jgi:hypothetical protein